MSEIRRKLLAVITSDNSWYRICPGGIYTTTNAYINTLQKGFVSKKYEMQMDHKVLVGDYNYQRILMGASDGRKYWIACPTFNHLGHPSGLDNSYGSGILDLTGARTFLAYKPFIEKRVNFGWPPAGSGENNYIQFYENGTWGEKIHAVSQYSDGSYTVDYNFYIFGYNNKGTLTNQANDIAIYNACALNNSVYKYNMHACLLTKNIPAELAWDNKIHYSGEYGMYDDVSGKFFGNANSTGYFIENID